MDGLLLWAAREIGADAEAKPGFHESEDEQRQRISDKADVLIVAMSAAASEKAMALVRDHLAETAIWVDGKTPLMGWYERHARLGASLQSALTANNFCLPTVGRQLVSGDVAVWRQEPGFPRVVRSSAGEKTKLVEPGDEGGRNSKNLATIAVTSVDLGALFISVDGQL